MDIIKNKRVQFLINVKENSKPKNNRIINKNKNKNKNKISLNLLENQYNRELINTIALKKANISAILHYNLSEYINIEDDKIYMFILWVFHKLHYSVPKYKKYFLILEEDRYNRYVYIYDLLYNDYMNYMKNDNNLIMSIENFIVNIKDKLLFNLINDLLYY